MTTRDLRKIRIERLDVLAMGLCVVLFVWLFSQQSRGFGFIDEGFYYSVTQRLARGDRFLIDEWHLGQFTALFQYIPYRRFTAVTGGTDGVILFMRYVYLTFDLVMFWLYYFRLKRFGLPGLLGAAAFCAYLFVGICALNYYTISLHVLMTIGLLIFLPQKEPSAPAMVFAGAALSCAVLSQPSFLFLYLLFSFFVLLRVFVKKARPAFLQKYDFVLNGRLWLWMSAGAAVCAVVFLAFLFARNGIAETFRVLPELLGDSEYAIHIYGNHANPYKAKKLAELYCAPLLILEILAIPAAAIVKKKCDTALGKTAMFASAALIMILSCICAAAHFFRNTDDIVYFLFAVNLHVLFLTPVCYILCNEKQPRVFAFWWVSLFTCVTMDFVSEATVDFGASLSFFPAILFISVLRKETRGDKTAANGKAGKLLYAAAAALCAALLLWNCFTVGISTGFPPGEKARCGFENKKIDARLTSGPYKGIRTTEEYQRIYEDTIADLGIIRGGEDKPFYVAENMPYYYLIADKPFGTYSTWYVEDDSVGRMLAYWRNYPERQPGYVYIPKYEYYSGREMNEIYGEQWADLKCRFFQTFTESTVTEGKAGYIIDIKAWSRLG